MELILRYIKRHKKIFLLALLVKFLGTTVDLIIPWTLAHVIDVVVPTQNIWHILMWGGFMVLSAVLGCVTNLKANRLTSQSAARFAKDLKFDIFEKVLKLSSEQLDYLSVPSVITRVTTDTNSLHQFISITQRMGIRSPILLVGSIFMTLMIDVRLALVMICTLPILVIIVVVLTKKGVPLFDNSRKTTDNLTSVLRENISGAKIIKAFNKNAYEEERFNTVNTANKEATKKAETLMAISNPLISVCINIGMVLVLLLGAYFVSSGVSTPGTIITFMTCFSLIAISIMTVTRVFIMSSKSIASANRLQEILDMEVPETKTISSATIASAESKYHIEFNNVNFSYLKKKDNLKNISFAINRGESLGILGGIGAGKSTIVNLLLHLYDADSGNIYINGKDINSIPEDILYKMIGVVFQKDRLLQATIYDNISFGRKLPFEDIPKACEVAQATEFISQKVDGLQYQVAVAGKNLSGGQRQRLLIARALAQMPEILLLDDVSSALDYHTDSLLRKALNEQYADSSKIIIAQRISSIRHCEHIMLLSGGEVVGYGTHEQLLANCSAYKYIYTSQGGEV